MQLHSTLSTSTWTIIHHPTWIFSSQFCSGQMLKFRATTKGAIWNKFENMYDPQTRSTGTQTKARTQQDSSYQLFALPCPPA
jgi:hypothetical protein